MKYCKFPMEMTFNALKEFQIGEHDHTIHHQANYKHIGGYKRQFQNAGMFYCYNVFCVCAQVKANGTYKGYRAARAVFLSWHHLTKDNVFWKLAGLAELRAKQILHEAR